MQTNEKYSKNTGWQEMDFGGVHGLLGDTEVCQGRRKYKVAECRKDDYH